ncbi:tRNA dihydrouridine synthase [Marinobacterium sediminicola]|uniref:tRNA-dihydrouridine(16) synthase n=1 Tax=Marinobacterium sediminicola TaxID=518898 RepID=A0ABY1RVH5_9GAMM|nr:tRNA-dihydrouridine synthase family protein [Marinobacterium sediminicola]ULG70640.1 tRNA-dihydrouridine synthase family protein [Marinobacterium sediminicola]SMR68786.1 tRNA-U20a,U20b-dihydrouridine synthase [Marinobacterium sediminicola]
MKIYLAPMEGVLDHSLRDILTRISGIDVCVTEFIRVTDQLLPESVFQRLAPELSRGSRTPTGTPVLVQLLGNDPVAMGENAVRAVEMGAPGIDLNFGCPAKTVNKSRGGAILLKDPEEVHDITLGVSRALSSRVPLSAKMRLGFQDKSLAIENAQALEAAGAVRLTVHARTKVEGYKPPAHWEWIARIRESVSIPVIANGDIWTVDDYHRCRAVSGCNDVMIGRGLIANPFLANAIQTGQGQLDALSTWDRTLELIRLYHEMVAARLEAKHVNGRTKQWLRMMQRHYPQAEKLFHSVRAERDPERFAELLREWSVTGD